MRIPPIVQPDHSDEALEALRCYFGLAGHNHDRHVRFTGARYDSWSSTSSPTPPDEFTADDLVAVTFLSVSVPGTAAIELLGTQRAHFTRLLRRLGPDRDLVDVDEPIPDSWVGWELMSALRALPGVGPVTASKLLARKRPRLRPIYDKVVSREVGSDQLWEPLRQALRSEGGLLHAHLLDLRARAGLPDSVSALRVFDVAVWMRGKGYPSCGRKGTFTAIGVAPSSALNS